VPNRLFAFALFLSSYSPAFLILAVRAIGRSCLMFWVSLGVAVVSALAFLLFIRVARKGGPFRAKIVEVAPRDADLAAYVATYLLPFLLVFGADVQDVIALALFLAFIGLLWVNSDMIYLNPLLALVGYRVYIAQVRPIGEDSDTLPASFLLSFQRDLRAQDEVRVDRLGSGVLIDLTTRQDANRT
jgi:hypothetical protein